MAGQGGRVGRRRQGGGDQQAGSRIGNNTKSRHEVLACTAGRLLMLVVDQKCDLCC